MLQVASRQQVQLLNSTFFLGQRRILTAMQNMNISDIHVVPCTNSKYIKTSRVQFKQSVKIQKQRNRMGSDWLLQINGNEKKRTWDYVNIHDAVAVMLFNTSRKAFILVRQFRPALYMYLNNEKNGKERSEMSEDKGEIPITAPVQSAVSYELCAGIVDKKKSLKEIAQEEVLEETGYEISTDNLQELMNCRAVGTSGNQVTVFYTEVTDDMKVGEGGGSPHEDEEIEVEYLPLEKAKEFVFDSSKAKPASLVAAFMWYFWKNKID